MTIYIRKWVACRNCDKQIVVRELTIPRPLCLTCGAA